MGQGCESESSTTRLIFNDVLFFATAVLLLVLTTICVRSQLATLICCCFVFNIFAHSYIRVEWVSDWVCHQICVLKQLEAKKCWEPPWTRIQIVSIIGYGLRNIVPRPVMAGLPHIKLKKSGWPTFIQRKKKFALSLEMPNCRFEICPSMSIKRTLLIVCLSVCPPFFVCHYGQMYGLDI